ncbi:hypothetical protein ACHQM5_005952 [Ranunculus cassubicifolius]
MANKTKRNNKKPLCERSMKIVLNIIKVSSLSLATMILGSPSRTRRTTHGNCKMETRVAEVTSVSKDNGSLKLKEPEKSLKPSSYLFNPNEEKASSYVICDGTNVDRKASDYIERFHAKNRNHSNDLKLSRAIIIPPPPLIR